VAECGKISAAGYLGNAQKKISEWSTVGKFGILVKWGGGVAETQT
jgi:hypothetical protein